MGEVIWRIEFDQQSAKQAGKTAGKEQAKEQSKGDSGADAAAGGFAGGFIGSILGELLGAVKTLIDPLTAIASLLVVALFPIFKPFLVLFLKIGLLLFRWLNGVLSGDSGAAGAVSGFQLDISEGEKNVNSSLTGLANLFDQLKEMGDKVITTVLSIPVLIALEIVNLFSNLFTSFAQKLDEVFGTNLLDPITSIFQGIANVIIGWYKTVVGILSFDFEQIKEGLSQILGGLLQIAEGIFGTLFQGLRIIFSAAAATFRVLFKNFFSDLKEKLLNAFEKVKDIGTFMLDTLKSIFTESFEVLKNIGSFIKRQIRSFFSFGSGSSSSVNDAIITPNGDIIRTNPSDYLIATKTPGALAGGGGSKEVNVTINGGLITEDVAREIGRIITRETSFGGNF